MSVANKARNDALSKLSLQEKKDLFAYSATFWADSSDETAKQMLKDLNLGETKELKIDKQMEVWAKVDISLLLASSVYLTQEVFAFKENIRGKLSKPDPSFIKEFNTEAGRVLSKG